MSPLKLLKKAGTAAGKGSRLLRRHARYPIAVLRWRPFDHATYVLCRRLQCVVPNLHFVLDGGANVGQFSRAIAQEYPGVRILAVEPIADTARLLRSNLRDVPQLNIAQVALGSARGTASMYRHTYSEMTSMLDLSKEAKAGKGASTTIADVEVVTLDALLRDEDIPSPALLKLDLEGFSLEALKGATECIRRFDHVLVEVEYLPLYEHEPTLEEHVSFLSQHGFRLKTMLYTHYTREGIPSQADALFSRTDA